MSRRPRSPAVASSSIGSRRRPPAGRSCPASATTGTTWRSTARAPHRDRLPADDRGLRRGAGPAAIPGPTLYAEVGDTLVVHFRNALTGKLAQPVTMHPHGVKYNPEYDGVFLGGYTRAGGFVAPARSSPTRGRRPPERRRLAVPRPRAQPHAQHLPRDLRRDRHPREGRDGPGRRRVALPAPAAAARHRPEPLVSVHQRARLRGQHAHLRAKVGQEVALHVFGMDNNFHDFHIHGHRWKDRAGAFVDTPSVGPNETTSVRFVEDNPGRWLYHCHVFSHQDGGMAGWYLVE